MIRIYCEKLMYSPFEFQIYRQSAKSHKIFLTQNIRKADVIMSSYLTILEKYVKKFRQGKRYLLWTHEPYHNFNLKTTIKSKVNPKIMIEIMNVYTGDVFTHNFRYFYYSDSIKMIKMEVDNRKQIVVLSTYYPKSYYQKNPHSILTTRYNLIETGFKRSSLDVYGKNWDLHPFVRSQGNSRNNGDRRESKKEILEQYRFNLCLENTNFRYYVTEKIWESIRYGCLPIYYANETIYDIFPVDSFVDAKLFINSDELYDYLDKMSPFEYETRLNKCFETFNQVINEKKNTVWRGKSDNQNINYLEYESCYQGLIKKLKDR